MGSQETEGGEMDEMDTAMELRHPGYRLDDSHALPPRGYLTIVGRTGVRPDSVQVLDGMLASRLPTSVIGVALHRFAFPSFTVPVVAEEGSAQLEVAVPARRPQQ